MRNETEEARHRRDAERFRRLSVHAADPALRRVLAALAEQHARIANRLAALNERMES
jgi:hypothetical protein